MYGIAVSGAGQFVAVGFGGGPRFATSSDGSTWTTPALMNGSSASANQRAVAVNSSGLFVSVGQSGSSIGFATST
jgi:hypothetical protein